MDIHRAKAMALQSVFPLGKDTTPGTRGKDITIRSKNEQQNWPLAFSQFIDILEDKHIYCT